MNDNSRPRGVIVFPMTEFPEVNGPVAFGRYALMLRGDTSEVRMVHTEGVAYQVTDEKPWGWTDNAPCQKFTPSQLIDMINFDAEGVDLADWIHTFGARLESNFTQAYSWATQDVEV